MKIQCYAKNSSKLLLPLCFLILFFGCQTENITEPTLSVEKLIQPPIEKLTPTFEEKEFNIAKGMTWNFSNGTSIYIPPNALMDEDSNALTGKAILKFRDYHDAVDVFLSGIPMGYDDGKGEKGNMETAGMFEIRTEANGKNALLQEGKEVQVNLGTTIGGKGYNSYFLDEEKREWVFLEKNKAKKNSKKINQKKIVEELRPGMPFPLDRKYFALDYRVLLDEFYSKNITQANNQFFQEQLEAYGLAWLDTDSKDGVEYNGNKKPAALMVWKKISEESFPSWVKNSTCEFKKKSGNRYFMRIHEKDKKYFTDVEVEWVMPVSYLFKLPPEDWANDYQASFTKFKKEEKRMNLMTNFIRSLEVQEFGIYNYDRIMKEEKAIPLLANFEFEASFDETVSKPDVYYIPSSERALVKYPQKQWSDFPLMPDNGGRIFSLLPGNKIALYEKKKYRKIPFPELRQMEQPAYEFEMAIALENISSPEQLKKVLLN